jgi:hypothetical protein
MTDIPIIFSAPMIRALLDGRKTMTRRLAWHRPYFVGDRPIAEGEHVEMTRIGSTPIPLAYRPSPWQLVQPGDQLYVREAFCKYSLVELFGAGPRGFIVYRAGHPMILDYGESTERVEIRAGTIPAEARWKPSIHMPRALSRLTLTVTATKIERLQELTAADAIAEGISWSDDYEGYHTEECRHYHGAWPERSFASLWRSLHGEESWDANPEVVALTFDVAKRNIDAREAA